MNYLFYFILDKFLVYLGSEIILTQYILLYIIKQTIQIFYISNELLLILKDSIILLYQYRKSDNVNSLLQHIIPLTIR